MQMTEHTLRIAGPASSGNEPSFAGIGAVMTTGVAALYGKWPGDESEGQLLAALRELD